jgi:cysteine desulfurase
MKRIYLDHAATTYLDDAVKAAMEPFWQENFGNASTIYKEGIDARNALNASRKKIASLINSHPDEIIFTNGGTESDNLAIFGVVRQYKKGHIITTKIEHHAVLNPFKFWESKGFDVTYLNVTKEGIVDLKEFKKALRKDTVLVSIMYANNEIGTIQPIAEISKIIRNFRKSKHEARSTKKVSDFGFQSVSAVSYRRDSGSRVFGFKCPKIGD